MVARFVKSTTVKSTKMCLLCVNVDFMSWLYVNVVFALCQLGGVCFCVNLGLWGLVAEGAVGNIWPFIGIL
jgi:hypothetical protein